MRRPDAGAMLPTKSKVIDSAWFPLIMTDAALFHALVSTSALFGLHDMVVQRKHMGESIKLINSRLLEDSATSDATITAILFMAKAEASYIMNRRRIVFCSNKQYSTSNTITAHGPYTWLA